MNDKPNDAPRETWLDRMVKPFSRPELAAMLMLGFASGLPLYLLYQKTSFWMREEGVDLSTIGYFYWLGMFYSFKFIWAPIIDRVDLPWLTKKLGHRRSWMLLSVSGTVIGLVTIAGSDPSEGLTQIIVGALFLAFSGATLDISIDAWRIESAPSDEQASMAASYSFGYRGALMFSGLSLAVAEYSSWFWSFMAMAAAMALVGGLIFLIREPQRVGGRKAIHDLPLLAGPAQAMAVALAFFGIAKVMAWMNLAEVSLFGTTIPLLNGLVACGVISLLAGSLIWRGTKMSLPWRLIVGAAALGLVYSGPIVDQLLGAHETVVITETNEVATTEEGETVTSTTEGAKRTRNKQVDKLWVVLTTVAFLSATIWLAIQASFATSKAIASAGHTQQRGQLYEMFAVPFLQVVDRFGKVLVPIFLLVMIYRLSDFTMGVMATPLYADLGFGKDVVGAIQSLPGVISVMVGLAIGGLAAAAFGITWSLVLGAALTLVTNGAYAWFAGTATAEDIGFLAFAICADNVAGGFVTTVFIAYLSSLVDPAQAATQYALFSSLYATLNKFVAGFSGQMAEALGYVNFFLVTASYAIPAGALVLVVAWLTKRYPPKELTPA